jgi:excinuclease ABC subunit C
MNEPFDAKSLLATLTELPGVYRMLDSAGNVLYVGKAKNLRKRVASYFRENHASPRIALMVAQIARVETTVTRSEAEALLLENNLIKSLSPRYNILFRDDKSYPYIVLSHDRAPRLGFSAAPPTSGQTISVRFRRLRRSVTASTCCRRCFACALARTPVFNNRSRPCLLYQIKRCSAPALASSSLNAMAEDVQMAVLFLQGRQQDVIGRLSAAMDEAAEKLAFEQAAVYRDQIQSLRQVQEKQYVDSGKDANVDIVVAVDGGGLLCVNLAMVRGGRHLGDRPQFPANSAESSPHEALAAFLYQHYLAHPIPAQILVNLPLADGEVAGWLSEMAGRPVRLAEAQVDHATHLGRNGGAERPIGDRHAPRCAVPAGSAPRIALQHAGPRSRGGHAHRMFRYQPYAGRRDSGGMCRLSGWGNAQVRVPALQYS